MDDDDISISPYEEGTWEWSDANNCLEFKSSDTILSGVPSERIHANKIIKSLEFADSPDLYDVLRFQKHYQRQMADGDNDVVTLQDIKDVVLFSAPAPYLNIHIVNILHLPATERFLRALIFYCQYFLQVEEILGNRALETKLPSRNSDAYEAELSENLQDIRFLVAKEYSTLIIGGDKFGKYHHMGSKKYLSATARDADFYETFFRLIVQIVWVALGRRCGKDIEVEVNRLFKSDRFNFAEHKYRLRDTKSTDEQLLMTGCAKGDRLLKTVSPLIHEIFCQRRIPYRMSGIGVVNYPNLTARLKYFKRVLILPEEEFRDAGITAGILGLARKRFDPMLKEIKQRRQTKLGSISRKMSISSISLCSFFPTILFADIDLPNRQLVTDFGDEFPCETYSSKPINVTQKRKWIEKVHRRSKRKRDFEYNLLKRRSMLRRK